MFLTFTLDVFMSECFISGHAQGNQISPEMASRGSALPLSPDSVLCKELVHVVIVEKKFQLPFWACLHKVTPLYIDDLCATFEHTWAPDSGPQF